jgi:hypothetical protein
MAVPINPLAQPRCWRNTPTNGPMPDCMSAMKKLSANSGQMRGGEGRDVIETLNVFLPIDGARAKLIVKAGQLRRHGPERNLR